MLINIEDDTFALRVWLPVNIKVNGRKTLPLILVLIDPKNALTSPFKLSSPDCLAKH